MIDYKSFFRQSTRKPVQRKSWGNVHQTGMLADSCKSSWPCLSFMYYSLSDLSEHKEIISIHKYIFVFQKWERRTVQGANGQQLKHMTYNICIDSTSLTSGQELAAEVCDQSVPGQRWKFTLNSIQ